MPLLFINWRFVVAGRLCILAAPPLPTHFLSISGTITAASTTFQTKADNRIFCRQIDSN